MIIPPVYSVGWHWQTGTKDDFPSLFSLLSMASVNNIGGMFLVCVPSIKQTMKIKVLLRIPLTDNILEPVNVASICCSSSNEGFSWCFQKSFSAKCHIPLKNTILWSN